MAEVLRIERHRGCAWLRMTRPTAMNAVNLELIDAMRSALVSLATDREVRVLLLTGSGSAFCAGADLKEVLASRDLPPGEADYVDRFAELLEALRVFPRPVIAVLNGVTLAGGLELAMCCDLVVAADTARIGDAHANYGVFPGGGGSAVLPTQVPRNVARYLLFTGGTMSAAQLHALGFVNEVHPADTLDQAAQTLAERIAEKSPLALSRMKAVANQLEDCGPTAALNHEQVLFRQHQRSWDMNEGLTAFAEKRKPVFRGI